MFMQVGISPELTQAAYRVGDSVANVITPLNPYMVIILVFVQRHAPRAGLGTVVALMLPYTLAFGLAWSLLLVVWMLAGLALGPAGPLVYPPGPA
jgi:aminobenzoyl-glutamate transport protein